MLIGSLVTAIVVLLLLALLLRKRTSTWARADERSVARRAPRIARLDSHPDFSCSSCRKCRDSARAFLGADRDGVCSNHRHRDAHGPSLTKRKHRRHLNDIVAGTRQTGTPVDARFIVKEDGLRLDTLLAAAGSPASSFGQRQTTSSSSMARPISAPAPAPMSVPTVSSAGGDDVAEDAAADAADDQARGAVVMLAVVAVVRAAVDAIVSAQPPRAIPAVAAVIPRRIPVGLARLVSMVLTIGSMVLTITLRVLAFPLVLASFPPILVAVPAVPAIPALGQRGQWLHGE